MAGENGRDIARYIERLARETGSMAASAGLGFLAYLLAMAAEEAASIANKEPRSRG